MLEADLGRYRMEPFLADDYEGLRKYDQKPIAYGLIAHTPWVAVGRMCSPSPSALDDGLNGTLLEEYIKDADLQGLTAGALDGDKLDLEHAFAFFDADPREIDRHDLRDPLYHLKNEHPGKDGTPGVAPSTVNNCFSALNPYFKFLKFEGHIQENLVPEFRERYLDARRERSDAERPLISVEDMAALIPGTLNVRNQAINLTLAKTSVRRNGPIRIDLDYIDWQTQSIRLRPTPKRSNMLVFFNGSAGESSIDG